MESEKGKTNREKFSGLILPWLEHLYRLFLDPFVRHHNLIIEDEFWTFLSFSIFSGILYYTGVSIWIPISFFFGAMVVLILSNSSYIRKKVFPTALEEIKDFMNQLTSKSTDEILRFIKDYQLTTSQIIEVLDYKKDNYDIYLFVDKYQSIRAELLEHLIDKKYYHFIEANLFSKYIKHTLEHISKEKYKQLKEETNNIIIKKTLNLCYPFYLDKHPMFNFFAGIVMRFRNAMNYGGVKLGIFVVSIIMVLMVIVANPVILQQIFTESTSMVEFVFGGVGVAFVFAGIITIFILFIIKLIFNLYRSIIYFIAPVD